MKMIRYSNLLFICLVLAPGYVFGQLATGEVRLEVKDPSGSGMEAAGTLESLAAGIKRNFTTTSQGRHTFASLPFGVYRLRLEREGFASTSVLIEVHSELPVVRVVSMDLRALQSDVEILDEQTLLNPTSTGAAQHLGGDAIQFRTSSTPGRSVLDLVNQQPGWLLEANGILHPRASEYDVQYVIDGIPLYDNRSPAFAQTLGIDDFETLTVRTGNYPAEFGRKLGGIIEVNTQRDGRHGWHGQTSLQAGSFRQRSGFASIQYAQRANSFSISGEGMKTDRYLDPPVIENYTNRASGGGVSARFNRTWSTSDTSRIYFQNHHTGFLVPNELLQQSVGQRQDRAADETSGQISHTHVFSATAALLQARAMVRDTSSRLWSNALSTPILPDQNRGFREAYAGGSFSIVKGSHELKAGGDAVYRSIHEEFGFRIITRRLNPGNVRVFDGDVPATFRFTETATNHQRSFFVQDLWRRGGLTLSGGLRFDHYRLRDDGETEWSPRLAAAYHVAKADLVLRASYDRIFQEPAVENILFATSDLVDELGGEGVFIPLKPARGYFNEVGFSKRLFGLRMDGTWYRRQLRNFADDALLLNTGVSFPVAFKEGRVNGYEVKLELPRWGRVSSSASYSNMIARGTLPVAGGLFLGDEADEALGGEGSFPITQDQRNTFRFRGRGQLHPRVWVGLGGSYNSGLPFEIEGISNLNFISGQYGQRIIERVNFDRGRVLPSVSLDLSVGVIIMESDRRTLRLQADVFNLANRLNLINFSGLLSGTALEAGRNAAIRLNASF